VVVLNNVFEWFADSKRQNVLWEAVLSNLSPGTLLVTYPSIEQSIRNNTLSLPSMRRLEEIHVLRLTTNMGDEKPTGLDDVEIDEEVVEDCNELTFYRVL
jgi:hypothetical protein